MELFKEFIHDFKKESSLNITNFNNVIKKSFLEDPVKTIDLILDLIFNKYSTRIPLKVCRIIHEKVNENNCLKLFNEKVDELMNKYFWSNEKPTFYFCEYMINMFGVESFFLDKEEKFIDLMVNRTKDISQSDIFNALRLTEKFVNYIITKNVYNEIDFINNTSRLMKHILVFFDCIQEFNELLSCLRVVSSVINRYDANSRDGILQQFKNIKDSRYYFVLLSFLSKYNKNFVELCLKYCVNFLGGPSTEDGRLFCYYSLLQIVDHVYRHDEFLRVIVNGSHRDIDTRNQYLSSTLNKLMNKIFKIDENENRYIAEKIYSHLHTFPDESKSKITLLIAILPYIKENIKFEEISRFLHLDIHRTLLRKLLTSYLTLESSKLLISYIIEYSIHALSIYTDLDTLEHIFGPVFNEFPEVISYAFEMFAVLDKDFRVWMEFEALRVIPKSRWILSTENIIESIKYCMMSGNLRLRVLSVEIIHLMKIFSRSFKQDYPNHFDEFSQYFVQNFNSLLLTDDYKTIEGVLAALEKIISDSNALEHIVPQIWDILDQHLHFPFVTMHKSFALRLTNSIFRSFTSLNNHLHNNVLFSCLTDSTMTKETIKEIKYRYKKDERIKEYCEKNNIQINDDKDDDEEMIRIVKENIRVLMTIDKDDWERQLDVTQLMLKICRSISDQEIIIEVSESLYRILLESRHIGIVLYAKDGLHNLLTSLPDQILRSITNRWVNEIISIVSDFDMGSMRRSAALPYIVQTIIKVQKQSFIDENSSLFYILKQIIEVCRRTDNHNEIVNCLNVISYVILDKNISHLFSIIHPDVLQCIFDVVSRFSSYEIIASANLCLSAFTEKSAKVRTSLQHFFEKINNSRNMIMNALKSNIQHLSYIAIILLCEFKAEVEDDDLVVNIFKHLGNRNKRFRRSAARAVNSATPLNKKYELFDEACLMLKKQRNKYNFCIDSYNKLHSVLCLIHDIIDSFELFDFKNQLPDFKLQKIPPPCLEEIVYIYDKLKIVLPQVNIKEDDFIFDNSILMLENKDMNNFSDRSIVAMSMRYTKNYPNSLPNVIIEKFVNKENIAIDNIGLNTILKILNNNNNLKISTPNHILVDCILREDRHYILAHLIDILSYKNPQPNIIDKVIPKFIDVLYLNDEDLVSVYISITNILPQLFFSEMKYELFILLLISDFPIVRTNAMKEISKHYNINFSSEYFLLEMLWSEIVRNSRNTLVNMLKKVVNVLDHQNTEVYTIIVDEFYIIRNCLKYLNIEEPAYVNIRSNIIEKRKDYLSKIKAIIHSL